MEGVGLDLLLEVETAEHQLLMLGWADAGWHLEFVLDPDVVGTPTDEDLLVLYLAKRIDESFVDRIKMHGGQRVPARNPYWED